MTLESGAGAVSAAHLVGAPSRGHGRETVEVLWCPDSRYNRRLGWRFPRQVEELLRELTAGGTTLHLFGGKARWGVRLDIDPATRPDVIGDAFLSPFGRDSFDHVIIDPPYTHMPAPARMSLFRHAGWIARESVIWFHTHWPASNAPLRYERGWLVRTGRGIACRCVVVFSVQARKELPRILFARGPRTLFNKWEVEQGRLAL